MEESEREMSVHYACGSCVIFFTCRCNSSNVAGKMESVVTWNTNEKAEVPIADEVFPFASFRSFQPQPQTTAEDGLRIAPMLLLSSCPVR